MRIYLLPVKQQAFLILSTDYRTVFSLGVGGLKRVLCEMLPSIGAGEILQLAEMLK